MKNNETHIFQNSYKCDCGEEWEDNWSCACNDRCPSCNKEIEPYESKIKPHVIEIPCHGIRIELDEVDPDDGDKFIGGIIYSEFDEKRDKTLNADPFSVAYDTMDAFILACACAGIDVKSPAFVEAIKTVADKISNEYGD